MIRDSLQEITKTFDTIADAVSLRYDEKNQPYALVGLSTAQVRFLISMPRKLEEVLQADLAVKAGTP